MTKDLNPKEYKQMMEYLTRKKPETIRNPVEVPQTQLKPLIDLEKELAKYWKKHYNTEEGAGSVEHILELTEGKL